MGRILPPSIVNEGKETGSRLPVDRTSMIRRLIERAEWGDPESQYKLGLACASGEGVRQDNERALYWYLKAAQKGYVEAQRILGGKYLSGKGARLDIERAEYWYLKAASQGDVKAQYGLGMLYAARASGEIDEGLSRKWFYTAAENGELRAKLQLGYLEYDRNPKAAIRWFKAAADQGLAEAQRMMGDCFSQGKGLRKNDTRAIEWYNLAAKQGDSKSQYKLGVMYAEGRGCEVNLNQAEVWFKMAAEQGDAQAQFRLGMLVSLTWCRKAAEQGNPDAQVFLQAVEGKGLRHSQNPLRQYENAESQAKQSIPLTQRISGTDLEGTQAASLALWADQQQASKGDKDAMFRLAIKYMNGYGVEQDREKAIGLMSQLAEAGDPKAQWNLAELYAREKVDQHDQDQSVRWYQQAADNGFPAAQAKLGLMYALGQGVEQDYAVATMYWTQAAQAGDPEAQYNLAWIMLGKTKTGSTKNRKLAVDWLRRAAEQAVPDAQIQLGLLYATGEMGEVDLVEAYQWFSLAEKSGSKAAKQNRQHAESMMSDELLKEAKEKLREGLSELIKH